MTKALKDKNRNAVKQNKTKQKQKNIWHGAKKMQQLFNWTKMMIFTQRGVMSPVCDPTPLPKHRWGQRSQRALSQSDKEVNTEDQGWRDILWELPREFKLGNLEILHNFQYEILPRLLHCINTWFYYWSELILYFLWYVSWAADISRKQRTHLITLKLSARFLLASCYHVGCV